MSEHFSENEFIHSEIAKANGITNEVPSYLKIQMLLTLSGLERIRAILGFPIFISSGYRCDKLNTLVGGAEGSQHVKAEAVDFTCPAFGSPLDICMFLKDQMGILGIDQLIMEGTWVHVSFTLTPRKEALTLTGNRYLNGIVKIT